MTIKSKLAKLMTAAAFGVVAMGSATAAVNGSIWINDLSNNADIVPAGPADATFVTNLIDYNSDVGGYTIGGFLNNPVFLTGGALATASLQNTHIQLTGSTFLNAGMNSFVVPHDDGIRIVFGGGIGNVIDQPGPTAPVDSPFNVNAPAAGLYSFVLDYNECCGAPARLGFKINGQNVGGAVPEPATWGLMIAGFGVSGMALRRRRRAALAEVIA